MPCVSSRVVLERCGPVALIALNHAPVNSLSQPMRLALVGTLPVIARTHGFAIGGRSALALACHHRVAERHTRIALPEIRQGRLPPSGSQRMPRAIDADIFVAGLVGARRLHDELAGLTRGGH